MFFIRKDKIKFDQVWLDPTPFVKAHFMDTWSYQILLVQLLALLKALARHNFDDFHLVVAGSYF